MYQAYIVENLVSRLYTSLSNSCQVNLAYIPQARPIDPSLFSLESDHHTKMELCDIKKEIIDGLDLEPC